MVDKQTKRPGTKGGVPSRDQMYRKIAMRAYFLIDYLFDVMSGDVLANPVKISAAKCLINKALPDLRAMEVSGKDGEQLKVIVLTGEGFTPPPTGSAITGQPQIQGSSLAPKGT